MDLIPPEILLHVFTYLDGPAPSEMRLHDQPSLDLLTVKPGCATPLKAASLVSKSWRTLVLPSLFRNVLWKPNITSLSSFTLNPIPLLRFLVENRLARSAITFTLVIEFDDPVASDFQITPKIRPADLEWLWDQLFSIIDPLRFTILARPTTIAALLSRQLSLSDAWAFEFQYQILSLARTTRGTATIKGPSGNTEPSTSSKPHLSSSSSSSGSTSVDAQPITPAPSSTSRRYVTSSGARSRAPPPCPLFTVRPWTSLLLNEGSFMKVYHVYEFFQRRPPSILGDLVDGHTPLLPSTVVDFNYIAIFPLSSHFGRLLQDLPRLDRLYVQITPKPGSGSGMLEDEEEMKRINAADLWMERNTCYSLLVGELINFNYPQDDSGQLRFFERGEDADRDAWEMALQSLGYSELEGWKAGPDGHVFTKHVDNKEFRGWTDQVNGHVGGFANADLI